MPAMAPFEQGYYAAKGGAEQCACPYTGPRAAEWVRGFRAQHRDRKHCY